MGKVHTVFFFIENLEAVFGQKTPKFFRASPAQTRGRSLRRVHSRGLVRASIQRAAVRRVLPRLEKPAITADYQSDAASVGLAAGERDGREGVLFGHASPLFIPGLRAGVLTPRAATQERIPVRAPASGEARIPRGSENRPPQHPSRFSASRMYSCPSVVTVNWLRLIVFPSTTSAAVYYPSPIRFQFQTRMKPFSRSPQTASVSARSRPRAVAGSRSPSSM